MQTEKIRDFSVSSWLSQKDSSILLIIILEKLLSLRIELIFFFFNRRNRLTSLRSLFCCGLFFIYHQVCYREINGNKWTVSHPAKLLLLKRTRLQRPHPLYAQDSTTRSIKRKQTKKSDFFIFLSFIFEIVMTKLSKTKLRIISQKTENYFCL